MWGILLIERNRLSNIFNFCFCKKGRKVSWCQMHPAEFFCTKVRKRESSDVCACCMVQSFAKGTTPVQCSLKRVMWHLFLACRFLVRPKSPMAMNTWQERGQCLVFKCTCKAAVKICPGFLSHSLSCSHGWQSVDTPWGTCCQHRSWWPACVAKFDFGRYLKYVVLLEGCCKLTKPFE